MLSYSVKDCLNKEPICNDGQGAVPNFQQSTTKHTKEIRKTMKDENVNTNRDINYKKEATENPVFKNTITEIKNSLQGFNCRFE